MVALYTDNDVHTRIAALLGTTGHTATAALAEGLAKAPDYEQLIVAAQRGADPAHS